MDGHISTATGQQPMGLCQAGSGTQAEAVYIEVKIIV